MEKTIETKFAIGVCDELENIWGILEHLIERLAFYDDFSDDDFSKSIRECGKLLEEAQEKTIAVNKILCNNLVNKEEFQKLIEKELKGLK